MMHTKHRSPRRRNLWLAASTAIGAGILAPALGSLPASAAGFVVTNTNNTGAGSLRGAIQAANAAAGQDTITFNLPNPTTISLVDKISITDDLRIEGPGQAALTITSPNSRVFDVSAGSLYVDSLTIDASGYATNLLGEPAPQNAILFTSPSGDVTLDDVTISDSANHALSVDGARNVTVTKSNLNNDQNTDIAFKGDGINAYNVSGNILIEDVNASGNEDNFELANVVGSVTMRRLVVTAAADEAADFQNIGSLLIESSVFADNTDQVDINVTNGPARVVDTTVSGTKIDDGIEVSDVAGGATIERSTISGSGQAGVFASGLIIPTTVNIVDSTISNNAKSGIIADQGSTVNISHSTVVNSGLDGINVVRGGMANTSHVILTPNGQKSVAIVAGSATVASSLLKTGSGYAGNGNIETLDSKLGPLSNNGGPTKTHLPLAGSPAINAGNPGFTPPPTVDQRGLPRAVGTIDIGAVEVQSPGVPPTASAGSVSILPVSVNVSESVGTVPFTVTRSGAQAGSGAASVLVSTQNLTAAAPGDFVALSQTLTFADGENVSKTVNLEIIDDAKIEGSESLKVLLGQPTGGLAIGTSESTVTILDNDATTPPVLDPQVDAAGRFVALPPQRLFDTRADQPAPGPKGKLGADSSIDVQITGQGGVPAEATAVVMNLTMTESEGPGFVTAWPAGSARPLTSNLNYTTANASRPNLVTVPIGAGGKVSLYALSPVHLLGDVAGYYVDQDVPVAAGRFVSLAPTRIFDTRADQPVPGPKGITGNDSTIDVQVAGEGGLPSSGISAVVMNLTATESQAPGFVTAYPTNVARPTASVLNASAAGQTSANLVILPLGPDGKLRLYTLTSTHLLGDVMGYFTDGTAPVTTDGLFVPTAPTRVFDSRADQPVPGPKGFVGANSTVEFLAAGVGPIPADAAAVMFNITATQSAGPNFVTGWPTGLPIPLASLLNVGTGDTRPNATILAPGTGQRVSLYTLAGAHLIADTFGYYLG